MTAAFQSALGLLLLDATARTRYLADPSAYARNFDDDTAALLRGLVPADVVASADNLLDKRAGHVRELAPELVRALGARFRLCFRQHAEAVFITGHDKHRADALHFARTLRDDEDPRVRVAAQSLLVWLGAGTRVVQQSPRGALPGVCVVKALVTLGVVDGVLVVGSRGQVMAHLRIFRAARRAPAGGGTSDVAQ